MSGRPRTSTGDREPGPEVGVACCIAPLPSAAVQGLVGIGTESTGEGMAPCLPCILLPIAITGYLGGPRHVQGQVVDVEPYLDCIHAGCRDDARSAACRSRRRTLSR